MSTVVVKAQQVYFHQEDFGLPDEAIIESEDLVGFVTLSTEAFLLSRGHVGSGFVIDIQPERVSVVGIIRYYLNADDEEIHTMDIEIDEDGTQWELSEFSEIEVGADLVVGEIDLKFKKIIIECSNP